MSRFIKENGVARAIGGIPDDAPLTTFFGKYLAREASLLPSDYEDFDNLISNSVARSAIESDSAAMSQLRNSNEGFGKYLAVVAGLDPSSYINMDAISASSVAMSAVVASQPAMNALIKSPEGLRSVRAYNAATSEIVSNATALATMFSDSTSYAAILASNRSTIWGTQTTSLDMWGNGTIQTGWVLQNGDGAWTSQIDLSDFTYLRVDTQIRGNSWDIGIYINGEEKLFIDAIHTSWITRTINVSAYKDAKVMIWSYCNGTIQTYTSGPTGTGQALRFYQSGYSYRTTYIGDLRLS
ncbi:MAG: hypothetical protein WD061_00085 [Candidatus Saccharimonadales bacterium]